MTHDFLADDPTVPTDAWARLRSPSARDPWEGHLLDGGYRLGSCIGEGSTGRIYRAYQESTAREVAVKLLRPELVADADNRRRFLREARAASRINHPNVLTIYNFGRCPDGNCYLVMELVEGDTLRQALQRPGALPLAAALSLFGQIVAGVAAAHRQGVVHRDLHPGNIFLMPLPGGAVQAKVFDFGGARLLDTRDMSSITDDQISLSRLLGAIRYLAPERLQAGQQPDKRQDVYALGLLLYELCTGVHPFEAPDPLQIMAMQLREAAPSLASRAPGRWFAAELEALVRDLLAKDPAQRPEDAVEVQQRFEELRLRLPALALTVDQQRDRTGEVPRPPQPARPWWRPALWAAALALGTFVSGALLHRAHDALWPPEAVTPPPLRPVLRVPAEVPPMEPPPAPLAP